MGGNMGLVPTPACVEQMQKAYQKDSEVELVFMDDDYRDMPKGMKGKVTLVDAIGTIHVSWENGSSLGAAWNADIVKNLETGICSNIFWNDSRPIGTI